MFAPLVALALFGGTVWMVAQAIFMLMHGASGAAAACPARDTLTAFVEENYGTRFVPGNPLDEEGMRRL